MKNWSSILLVSLGVCRVSVVHSQPATVEEWTLERCIDHALRNNLKLKTTLLDISQSETTKRQAFNDHLPSLSAAATHGYNWGQSIDPFTNEFATKQVRTNNLYINGNWTLFNGLQRYYLTQRAKTETAYHAYNREVQKRNVKIDVTAHYLQVLLHRQKLLQANEQIAYTHKVIERTQKMVAAEQLPAHTLLEVKSQLALDSLHLTQTFNELRLSKLTLKQFLNLQPEQELQLPFQDTHSFPTIGRHSIPLDSLSVDSLPEVKQHRQQEKMGAISLKIAKGKLSPTLSLNASLGSGYSGNNVELAGTSVVPKPFNRQLGENFYQSATLTLNIPIFNRGMVGTEIAMSKLEIERASIQRQQTILALHNKIEQLNLEIENAAMQKKSAEAALRATQKSLEIAQLKYGEGAINMTHFLELRKKHTAAQAQFTNALFTYVFKVKIRSYYAD